MGCALLAVTALAARQASIPRGVEASLQKDDVEKTRAALAGGKLQLGASSQKGGNTAVHIAASAGAAGCLELLLSEGADASAGRGADGVTPLMFAMQNGHAPCVRLLLDAGSDVNAQERAGSAALHYAARHGREECLGMALGAKGASVDLARADGITALMVAAQHGHTECVRMLLRQRADAKRASKEGLAPIHYSSRQAPLLLLLWRRRRRDWWPAASTNMSCADGICDLHAGPH